MTVKREIITRFGAIYVIAVLIMIPILLSAGKTIFKEGDFWRGHGAKSKVDSLIVKPNRGNILAYDGKLLASSIPSYVLYMDFKAHGFKKDTLDKYIESVSATLAAIYKNKNKEEIKKHILQGYQKASSWYMLNPQKISYTDLKDVKAHPYFKKGPNVSGLCVYEQVSREKPFGSLASRTVGGLYGEIDKGGSSGLEMRYDSLLRGKPGISSKQKIAGKFRTVNQVDPVDGLDVKTTIDVNIQDIAESALLKELSRVDADRGCTVVMEVKTGEIRAISNLKRVGEGRYAETENFAVSSETEPGSTFKVASVIAALEDGVIDTSYQVDTEKGVWKVKGREMKDHNWNTGGYGKISIAQALWHSSNVGISKMICEHYDKKPERFVELIYKMGLNEPINLEIPGAGKPKIKSPKDPSANWSGTTLPWMSIGYETQIPPIYTLTFYNAIANNGRMVKPFFVKAICKDGYETEEFSTEVIKSSICRGSTLKKVNQMLIDVVEKGTAKAARSDNFQIAGKTGTAQVNYGKRGVTKSHQLTFCGYFPADEPKYSCIIVVWSPSSKVYPSAGNICGPVFKNIAERIYAQSPLLQSEPKTLCDTTVIQMPVTKDGKRKELKLVLNKLNIPYTFSGAESEEWIFSEAQKDNINMRTQKMYAHTVPNTIGMGAKDAVFLLENKGLKVRISGRGRVSSQSIEAGKAVRKGDIIQLQLQ
jgi:cell division protein FtsI (penicillin-binding protein 3)